MKLVGILTNRDVRFEMNEDRIIDEVMTKENLVTGRPHISMEEALFRMKEKKIEKLPIIKDDGTLDGLITIKDIEKIKTISKFCKRCKGKTFGRGGSWYNC